MNLIKFSNYPKMLIKKKYSLKYFGIKISELKIKNIIVKLVLKFNFIWLIYSFLLTVIYLKVNPIKLKKNYYFNIELGKISQRS